MKQIKYSIAQISKIIDAKFLSQSNTEEQIERIFIDSRQLHAGADTLFFAIDGQQHNAHDFIPNLIANGIQNFVVTQNLPESIFKNKSLNILQVKDSVLALQKLAAFHRAQFQIPIIGITGSNGKTVVKEWLFQLLDSYYKIIRSPKSYNSQVGVPLSVWQIMPQHQLGIFEAGISQSNEMQNLAQIIRPNIGILSNIGFAHSEGFESQEEKLSEKLQLFEEAEVLIYPADNPLIEKGIEAFNKARKKAGKAAIQLMNWGENTEAKLQVISLESLLNHTKITLKYLAKTYVFDLPFSDKASIENAISCAACALYLGISDAAFFHSFEQLSPVAMRLELKDAIQQCSIINDSYNSDLGSLKIALDFLNQQEQHANKSLILSDILQSGMSEEYLIEELLQMIQDIDLQRFITIGPVLLRNKKAFEQLKAEKHFYANTADFLAEIKQINFRDESILLKGARPFHFEKISLLLEQKFHETLFEINLNALSNNLALLRNHLGDKTKIMAMVKAFSYGSGPYEIASMLQFHRVDYLAVAYVDEGIALRNAGINLPTLVLNPDKNSFDSLLQYRLEPEIYSFKLWKELAEKLQTANLDYKLPIHIKIDSGMHRLGFVDSEIELLAEKIKQEENCYVASVFSHLSSSEDAAEDAFTINQIEGFRKTAEKLEKLLGYALIKHILNSSGILRFPQGKFDMVRAGLLLYGLDSTGILAKKLEPVGQLKTIISQIKNIEKGDSIGYNRKYIADKNMRIATIAIGYADGYRRSFGNGKAHVLIAGKKAPIVGNVCMDMCMVDLENIPDAQEGDEVIVFGAELPVERLAEWAETIPYEILTGIGERVKRVYFRE